MTFFGWFNRKRAVPQCKPTHSQVEVKRRRQYVEERFRPEAFQEEVRAEDVERYFRERGEVQGGLFR